MERIQAKAKPGTREWWAQHGISEEVADRRPYVPWTPDNLEPIKEGYAGLSPPQLRTLERWARQTDGLVIYRHYFGGALPDEDQRRRVYPEIRPEQAVVTETTTHYHGPPRPADDLPLHPSTGNPLPKKHVHTPYSTTKHIDAKHGGVNPDDVHAHEHRAKYLFPPSAKGLAPWIHSHKTEYEARVLRHLPDTPPDPDARPPEQWTMPGAEYRGLEENFAAWLDQHSTKHHYDAKSGLYTARTIGGRDFGFRTFHLHDTPAKMRGEQLAKRIDVHPLVWENAGFAHARIAWFGIEGCIKSDAILTALLRAGLPPAVFSVPSVGHWEATFPADEDEIVLGSELEEFAARFLRGKTVCIVPDADGHQKPEVMTMALLARTALRRLGTLDGVETIRAEIVFPPDDWLNPPTGKKDDSIKGIDDYLGNKGVGEWRPKPSIDELVWYDKRRPELDHVIGWLQEHGTWGRDRRTLERAAKAVTTLAEHAGDNGDFTGSFRMLSRALSRRAPRTSAETWDDTTEQLEAAEQRERAAEAERKTLERGFKDLERVGAISSNLPLTIRRDKWLRQDRGWHLERGLHWSEDDIVITVHENLRAPVERRPFAELRRASLVRGTSG